MSDPFYSQTHCDRCHKPLTEGRIMSMYNTDCICMECYSAERKRPDYQKALEAERDAVAHGNTNFAGIGL